MLSRHTWAWLAVVLIAAVATEAYPASSGKKTKKKGDDESSESKSTTKKKKKGKKKKSSEAKSTKKKSSRRRSRSRSSSGASGKQPQIKNPVSVAGKIVSVQSEGTGRRSSQTQYVLKAGDLDYLLKGSRLTQLRSTLAQNRDAVFQIEGRAMRTARGISLLVHAFRLAPEKETASEKKAETKDEEGKTEDKDEDKDEGEKEGEEKDDEGEDKTGEKKAEEE